jgi:hypothetical protein
MRETDRQVPVFFYALLRISLLARYTIVHYIPLCLHIIIMSQGWLQKEPAMLPNLMQAAWDWNQAHGAGGGEDPASRRRGSPTPAADPPALAAPQGAGAGGGGGAGGGRGDGDHEEEAAETATGLALLAHHGLRLSHTNDPRATLSTGGAAADDGAVERASRPLSPRDGNKAAAAPRIARATRPFDDWRSWDVEWVGAGSKRFENGFRFSNVFS